MKTLLTPRAGFRFLSLITRQSSLAVFAGAGLLVGHAHAQTDAPYKVLDTTQLTEGSFI